MAATQRVHGGPGVGTGLGVTGDSLTKQFPGGVTALEAASFEVPHGEFASLVGPSGCGKSTLLRLVAGLIERTGGSLRVGGDEVVEPRADIGLMFQKPTLLPWKTAQQNVLLPRRLRGKTGHEDEREADLLLRMVGLEGFEHTYPRHLSGGMQQRVALARLLMTGAELLLLDEPFGALDEFTRERLNVELLRIHEDLERTTMFVTHNIPEAIFLADHVFVMTPRPGRIAAIVPVPFPRPRSIELMAAPEFTELVFEVRNVLGEHS